MCVLAAPKERSFTSPRQPSWPLALWWRYHEVVMCLEGGPVIVVFYRDYLDPMMRNIMDPDDLFHTFTPHKESPDGPSQHLPEPLPHSPMPPGLMDML